MHPLFFLVTESYFTIFFQCFFEQSFKISTFFVYSIVSCFGISLFSCSVMSDSSWLHGLQQARLSCPSLAPRACLNSCPMSQWCHQTISSSVIPFSSCLQFFPASGSFWMSLLFASMAKVLGGVKAIIAFYQLLWKFWLS